MNKRGNQSNMLTSTSPMSVKSFFEKYQKANQDFDIEEIGSCYAEEFIFGQPDGVRMVKKEDFLRMLPKRKEMMQKTGQESSDVISLKETAISEQYTQVEVVWKMKYRKDKKAIEDSNTATYILFKSSNGMQIVTQIDHQDLIKKVQELGLLR